MIQLKKVGNFEELDYGDKKGPSLQECIAQTPQEFEALIIYYLKNGLLLAASAGVARDVLAKTREIIAVPDVLTDGVWMWHGDLEYYVRVYHCRVPEEFVLHMKTRNWQPPREDEVDIHELSRGLRGK